MFLDHLIERTLGTASAISPRRVSRFEPAAVEAETIETSPSSERVAAPMPAVAPPTPERHVIDRVERVETRIIERPETAERVPTLPHEESTPAAQPVSAQGPQPIVVPSAVVAVPVNVLLPTNEPRVDTPPAVRESVVHDRVESRVEAQTIERRLEQLRESHVEHVERVDSRIERYPEIVERPRDPSAVVEPRPPAAPVIPQVRSQPPVRPAVVQTIAARAEAPPAPTVHVTIGRVEVRAQAPSSQRTPQPRSREPKLGLEEYLQRRERA